MKTGITATLPGRTFSGSADTFRFAGSYQSQE